MVENSPLSIDKMKIEIISTPYSQRQLDLIMKRQDIILMYVALSNALV